MRNMRPASTAPCQKSSAASLDQQPEGEKYMFATACSKPAATKAAIGSTTTISRCAGRRLDSDSQTARQTSVLQSTPRMNAWPKGSAAFASAVRSAS